MFSWSVIQYLDSLAGAEELSCMTSEQTVKVMLPPHLAQLLLTVA